MLNSGISGFVIKFLFKLFSYFVFIQFKQSASCNMHYSNTYNKHIFHNRSLQLTLLGSHMHIYFKNAKCEPRCNNSLHWEIELNSTKRTIVPEGIRCC